MTGTLNHSIKHEKSGISLSLSLTLSFLLLWVPADTQYIKPTHSPQPQIQNYPYCHITFRPELIKC